MSEIDVSIIFVNYKTKDLTINAINSVIEKTSGINYEIIVVDNNSQDDSIDVIQEQFPNIKVIKNPENRGFGAGNNIGIKLAKGKYILCLNTDTLLINNAIKIMFDYMEQNINTAVCGGYLTDDANNPVVCGGNYPSFADIIWKFGLRSLFPKKYLKYNTGLKSDEMSDIKKKFYITGADIFFRKSVLDEVGLFDENFFMYYEETDLCKRISALGYKINYIEKAKIVHLESKSMKNQLDKMKKSKMSEIYYFKKHYRNRFWIYKVLYSLLYIIGWIVLKNKNSKELLKLIIKE